jgi:hypothetical protein
VAKDGKRRCYKVVQEAVADSIKVDLKERILVITVLNHLRISLLRLYESHAWYVFVTDRWTLPSLNRSVNNIKRPLTTHGRITVMFRLRNNV